ncbi:hypothetical protein MASR2M12_10390 [Bacteroidales bacterium]
MNFSTSDPLAGQKIVFPVTYILKVVVTHNMEQTYQRGLIEEVFQRMKVPFELVAVNASKQNTYLSFNFRITLLDIEQMRQLYGELQKIPWFKFAI